jgi:hypothetical protein
MCVGILTELNIWARRFKAFDRQRSTAKAEPRLNGFGEALPPVTIAAHAVNTNIDVMAEIFVEGGGRLKRCFVTVYSPVQIALLNQLTKKFDMSAFPRPNDRAPHGDSVRFHFPEDIVDDFLYRATCDFFTAGRTVWFSNSRPEQAEVILDLRDRCHR